MNRLARNIATEWLIWREFWVALYLAIFDKPDERVRDVEERARERRAA